MNIDDMTLGQIKELKLLFSEEGAQKTLKCHIGKKVIIRTYSAGVHYGILSEKQGNEVILNESRRLYYWNCSRSISLSGVAKYGLCADSSKVCAPIDGLWLEAIEILPLSEEAINSIEGCKIVEAE